jgi:hypothetical protein
LRCDDSCGFSEEVEPCSKERAVDVTFLLDVTGSNSPTVTATLPTLRSRCIEPLLGLRDVFVGVSYMGEFPDAPYGTPNDRPFEGGIEPTSSLSEILFELNGRPSFNGLDTEDATVEALCRLSGGPLASASLGLTCSSDRIAGGCWRDDVVRVIVLYTDSAIHNGPDPNSDVLQAPYSGIFPEPATWPDVRARMIADRTVLIFFDNESSESAAAQFDEMLSDLSLPSGYRMNASEAMLESACERVVTEVRTFADL